MPRLNLAKPGNFAPHPGGNITRQRGKGFELSHQNNLPTIIAGLPFAFRVAAEAGAVEVRGAIREAYQLQGPGWDPNAPTTVGRKRHEQVLVGRNHAGAHNRDAVESQSSKLSDFGAHVDTGWGNEQHPDASAGKSRGYIQSLHEYGVGVPRRPILGPIVQGRRRKRILQAMAGGYLLTIQMLAARRRRSLMGRASGSTTSAWAAFREVFG